MNMSQLRFIEGNDECSYVSCVSKNFSETFSKFPQQTEGRGHSPKLSLCPRDWVSHHPFDKPLDLKPLVGRGRTLHGRVNPANYSFGRG